MKSLLNVLAYKNLDEKIEICSIPYLRACWEFILWAKKAPFPLWFHEIY